MSVSSQPVALGHRPRRINERISECVGYLWDRTCVSAICGRPHTELSATLARPGGFDPKKVWWYRFRRARVRRTPGVQFRAADSFPGTQALPGVRFAFARARLTSWTSWCSRRSRGRRSRWTTSPSACSNHCWRRCVDELNGGRSESARPHGYWRAVSVVLSGSSSVSKCSETVRKNSPVAVYWSAEQINLMTRAWVSQSPGVYIEEVPFPSRPIRFLLGPIGRAGSRAERHSDGKLPYW